MSVTNVSEDVDFREESSSGGCLCCCCCKANTINPDLYISKSGHNLSSVRGKQCAETGYLIPAKKKYGTGKTMQMLRTSSSATRGLPSPQVSIINNNKKIADTVETPTVVNMNVSDVNNLLRRRLSLRILVSEENTSGEINEAVLPRNLLSDARAPLKGNFSDAAPILLSHLVKNAAAPAQARRKSSSVKSDYMGRFRVSLSNLRQSKSSVLDFSTPIDEEMSLEQKSDKEFIDYLVKASYFMKEALNKDWSKTRSYIKWLESYIKTQRFRNQAARSGERWMVVLYTSSEDSRDQLSNFRCMLVRLLLQNHCVLYEERDVVQPQFQSEFESRLGADPNNVPQVYMQGLNVGGYRVMFGIHRLGLTKVIFEQFIKTPEAYAEWMFSKESKSNQLSLEVNLKAFPALQALAGSWSNDKLSPPHLEFVTMGKFVVKHGRETWYRLSSRPYSEPELRRYALLRLTIIHALIAMNKIYKQYLTKIEIEGPSKVKRKLSWLPKFSKNVPNKD